MISFLQPEGFITSDPQYYKTICDYQWTGQEQLSSNIYLDGSKDEGNTGSYICIYAYGNESSTITLTGSFIEDFEQDDSNDEEEKQLSYLNL